MVKTNQGMPEGAGRMTPYLTVRDAEAAFDFYTKVFGFSPTEQVRGEDGKLVHAGMAYGGVSVVMFSPGGAEPPSDMPQMVPPVASGQRCPVGLYIYCADVDALVEHARKAGVKVLDEPETMFWGDRIARLVDLDNYEWTFATCVGEFDASKAPAGMQA